MFILKIRVFDRQVRCDSSHAQAPKKALMNKSITKNLVGQHKGSRAVTFPVPCAGYWGRHFPGTVTGTGHWNKPQAQHIPHKLI